MTPLYLPLGGGKILQWGLKYFDPLQDLESLPKSVITIVPGINL